MSNEDKPEFIPEYDGNDMAGYILKTGLELRLDPGESIQSITNIRNTAIIVTNYNIWRAKPCYQIGFSIERLCVIW